MTTPQIISRNIRSPALHDTIMRSFASGSLTAGILNIGAIGGYHAIAKLLDSYHAKPAGGGNG